MAEIENINNLTLAQLIEIWEFCNGAEDCRKCPLNDKSCAKILHTATLEALKNLVQLVDLQKAEVARLESDCKTLSAVLSRDVESDKEAVTAFVGFLEEHARTEVFKHCGLDLELKFVYIDDVKELEKEFWEGDEE